MGGFEIDWYIRESGSEADVSPLQAPVAGFKFHFWLVYTICVYFGRG